MSISDRIKDQFPSHIREDHPKFINFVENYYKFLESAELKLSGLSGTFTVGETVQGSVSKSKSIVNSIDSVNSRIFVSTQNGFIPDDVISGSTSLASGKFVTYTPNPVQTIDQLLAYRDSDSSIDSFFDEFRKEFMATIPKRITNSLDRNNLIKNINTLYKSKGTTDGHKLFFKILFNEFSDIYYPAKDVLKPSHGEWVYDTIIRVYDDEGQISDPSVLNGQTLHQVNDPSSSNISAASAVIEFAHVIYGSGLELNINKETIKGEFVGGEIGRIKGSDGVDYNFELALLPTKLTIFDPGQYYEVGEEVEFLGFQFPPIVKIANTSLGSISNIDIINGGLDYAIGDKLVFTNTGAQGYGSKSSIAEISALGGQFALEDATFTESNTFSLEDFTNIIPIIFSLEDGSGYPILEDGYSLVQQEIDYDGSGYPILEDGYSLVQEIYYANLNANLIQEDYTVSLSGVPSDIITQEYYTSDMSSISVKYGGQNYDDVPSLSISSESGHSAELLPITDNVASILDLDIFEPGFRYTPPNDLEYFSNVIAHESLVIKEISGIIDPTIIGKSITSSSGGSGQIIKYIPSTKVLKVKRFSGAFYIDDILTVGLNSGSCKIHLNETARMKISTGVVFTYPGKYIGENGFVSSFAKRIQDSVYYQDYSYVVKIGQSINFWKEELKRTMHPVGFNLFGEVNVVSLIYGGIKVPTADCTTFTPDLFSTLNIIFESAIKLQEEIVSYGRYRISSIRKHEINNPIKRIEQFKFAQTDYLKNQSWDPNGYYDIHLEDDTGSIEAENDDLIIQQVRRWLHPDTSLYGGHVDRGYSIKFINDYFPSISAVIDNPEAYTPITPPSEITIKRII